MSLPPANWYTDPWDSATLRYWDGTAWTGHTHPGSQQATQPTPQQAYQPTPQPIAPTAPWAEQGFDAIGGRVMTSGFGTTMTPGLGSRTGATFAQGPSTVTRSRRIPWLGLGVAGALVALLVTAVIVVIVPKFAPISADYTGAPVTSSDVASPGHRSVVSESETVAAEIPSKWDDLEDVEGLMAEAGGLPPGASLLGFWFTQSLQTATSMPQMVLVMEMTPTAAGTGTVDDIQGQVIEGMRAAIPNLVFGPSQDYTTALGLEGVRTDATYKMIEENLSCTVGVTTVAHGRRFVVVQWTSFDEPIDEASLDAFMAALRVDS